MGNKIIIKLKEKKKRKRRGYRNKKIKKRRKTAKEFEREKNPRENREKNLQLFQHRLIAHSYHKGGKDDETGEGPGKRVKTKRKIEKEKKNYK